MHSQTLQLLSVGALAAPALAAPFVGGFPHPHWPHHHHNASSVGIPGPTGTAPVGTGVAAIAVTVTEVAVADTEATGSSTADAVSSTGGAAFAARPFRDHKPHHWGGYHNSSSTAIPGPTGTGIAAVARLGDHHHHHHHHNATSGVASGTGVAGRVGVAATSAVAADAKVPRFWNHRPHHYSSASASTSTAVASITSTPAETSATVAMSSSVVSSVDSVTSVASVSTVADHKSSSKKTSTSTKATTSAAAATSSTTVKAVSTTAAVSTKAASTTSTSAATVATSAATAADVSAATATSFSTQEAGDYCGDADYIILENTPWIVYNMFYNAAEAVGTQCTRYDSEAVSSAGVKEVIWSSETNIEYVESTDNVPKGYSFVGLTENLETQVSAISSIPATYSWTRTNTTAFKGNTCFDFITSDTKGDSTSTAAQEHMLWLQYEGGQLPIGWSETPAATVASLFGTSWKLYSGVNTDTGITVTSLLPDTQFDGDFSGDLKEWFEALVTIGTFTDATYVNVGNAGTEMFYGDSILNATLGLQIDL